MLRKISYGRNGIVEMEVYVDDDICRAPAGALQISEGLRTN